MTYELKYREIVKSELREIIYESKENDTHKMVARSKSDMQQVINGIKGALEWQKLQFERDITNAHKLRDIHKTFIELEKLSEAVVKGKFGLL